MFFDVEKSREIAVFLKGKTARAGDLLAAGSRWSGAGWNTSRASRALQSLTGVPLVSSDLDSYKNAYLYALAILLDVDIPSLNLSDRAAEAALVWRR